MKNMKRLFALLLALSVVCGVLAGCGGNNSSDETQGSEGDTTGGTVSNVSDNDPQYGGHLDVRITVKPTGLDPLQQTGVWKYLYTTCVYENPLTRDADNNIAPGVCDFELSEDMLTLKMWVVEGKTFSNGDPVDIYDVEASINRALNRYNNIKLYVKPYVSSMVVEGDTLTITFSEYREKCLYYLAAYQTWCAVMPKEICEKYATTFLLDQMEDAIGTGPYVFSEFRSNELITVSKREDYVPVETEGTGFAGTKYGYMDSISFHYNDLDASAATALLAGEYDMVDVVPSKQEDEARAKGYEVEILPSNQTTFIVFNSNGSGNVCAKYPSLRKAIMAAIDYEEFLEFICDGSQVMDSQLIMDELYATDKLSGTDYYGPANQEVVDKYLAEARAEGYDDEPVQIVYNSSRDDILVLLQEYLDEAGIANEVSTKESALFSAFIADPSNDWDVTFSWIASANTPSLLQDGIMVTHWDNEAKDTLMEEMGALNPTSDEYMAKWDELAQMIADECPIGFMARINWWWWHPTTLHPNDEGDARYVYNTYWDDPANHPD